MDDQSCEVRPAHYLRLSTKLCHGARAGICLSSDTDTCRQQPQVSAMKFTSLIPMIIAAAMAGVVVASEDLVINPGNFQCDKNKPVACSRGIKGYNNEYDFGYNCGSNGLVVSWTPCHCHNCCHLINNGKAYSCT